MQYRYLGNSGLRVSTIALGTATFGGAGVFSAMGTTDVAGATRMVDMCVDAGVNLIDTANTYSNGLSEEILGQAVRGKRDKVLIATKARGLMGDGPNDGGVSRHHLIDQCEKSLKRLGVDHIDLYQLHNWDGITPPEETLGALQTLQQAGKIRYFGVSNYAGWQLMKSIMTSAVNRLPRIVSQQIYYSLECRDCENELIPTAIDQGLGVLIWSPLAGGLLTGKYRRGAEGPAGARHVIGWPEPPNPDMDRIHTIVAGLVEIAERHGATPAQVALAYLLAKPAVTSVIVGAKDEIQLAQNIAAAEVRLEAGDVERLDALSQQRLNYPYWHHALNAKDRLGAAELSLLRRHIVP